MIGGTSLRHCFHLFKDLITLSAEIDWSREIRRQ
jgi:hypothetical protein